MQELTDREAYLLLKGRNAKARVLVGQLTSRIGELETTIAEQARALADASFLAHGGRR